MPLPSGTLAPGEEVIEDLSPHWWTLVLPVASTLLAALGVVAAALLDAPLPVEWLVGLLLLIALAWLGRRWVRRRTTNLVVTTDRLVLRRGLLGRSTREIPLSHLNDITYRQTLGERLIGAGDLLFESAGRDGQEVFAHAPHPKRAQRVIYRQMEARQGGPPAPGWAAQAPVPGPPPPEQPSIPELIDQLDQLSRRGIISRAEFEAKKTELLRRM